MTNPRTRLRSILKNKLDIPHPVTGTLGNGDGETVVDTDLENHVWVRIHGLGLASILNKRVSPVYGRRVLVGIDPFEPKITQVLGTYTNQPDGEGGGAGLNYAPSSRYRIFASDGGEDPLWVEKRQFMPLRIGMTDPASTSIRVYRDFAWTGTAFVAVPSQSVDLSSYQPATSGNACLVLITLDDSGAVVCTAGSEFVLADMTTDALMLANLPAVPAGTQLVLGAVRCMDAGAQTAIQEGRTNTDIIDLRFSGWGAGSGGALAGSTSDYLTGATITRPAAVASWAWINQATATATDITGGIFLYSPAAAGDSLRILKKAAPATPYTITALIQLQTFNVNYPKAGLCWRQSSDGKLVSLNLSGEGGSRLQVIKWNGETSFNNSYYSENITMATAAGIWLRITDTGANRVCYWSLNGQGWIQIHSVSRTDFMTADEVGFFVTPANGTHPIASTLLSWKET